MTTRRRTIRITQAERNFQILIIVVLCLCLAAMFFVEPVATLIESCHK